MDDQRADVRLHIADERTDGGTDFRADGLFNRRFGPICGKLSEGPRDQLTAVR